VGLQLKAGAESFLRAMFYAGLMSAFVLGLFHIPTPSMEPTLLGNADPAHLKTCTYEPYHVSESGDSVIASKCFSAIDRFDVVVFRFPLNVSMRFVKRVIGLPGERLIMDHGELFRREGEEYRILRKPLDLQESLWIRVTPTYHEAATLLKDWAIEGEYQFDSGGLQIKPSGETSVRFHRMIYDSRSSDRRIVSDVRLSFDLEWKGSGEFSATIVNWYGTFRFQINPDRTAAIQANGRTVDVSGDWLRGERSYRMELIHLDGEFLVRVDGRTAGSIAHVERYRDLHSEALTGYQVGFRSQKLEARVRHLQLDRDLFFKRRDGDTNVAEKEEIAVPPGAYFVLGDNASVSKDARSWSRVRIHLRDGLIVTCEKGEIDRETAKYPHRDKDGEAADMVVKADEFGNQVVIFKDDIEKEGEPESFPFVEDRYIVGKAQLTFWPPGRWFRSIR
jgi:signal peptidase I